MAKEETCISGVCSKEDPGTWPSPSPRSSQLVSQSQPGLGRGNTKLHGESGAVVVRGYGQEFGDKELESMGNQASLVLLLTTQLLVTLGKPQLCFTLINHGWCYLKHFGCIKTNIFQASKNYPQWRHVLNSCLFVIVSVTLWVEQGWYWALSLKPAEHMGVYLDLSCKRFPAEKMCKCFAGSGLVLCTSSFWLFEQRLLQKNKSFNLVS